MSMNRGSFRPDELVGSDAEITDAERAASYAAARSLEQALSTEGIHPPAGFADRVMAAVALEPAPPSLGFLAPLHTRRGLAGVVASVRAAWVVAIGGGRRPVRARGLALAYALAVSLIGISLTGAAAFGTAGAIGLLTPDHTPRPSIVAPVPTLSPEPSSESSEPADSAEPGESTEPSGSPEASETAEPGDSGQSSGASGTSVPRASERPSGETQVPSGSDDGGGDGSSSPAPSSGSGSDAGSGSWPAPSGSPSSSD